MLCIDPLMVIKGYHQRYCPHQFEIGLTMAAFSEDIRILILSMTATEAPESIMGNRPITNLGSGKNGGRNGHNSVFRKPRLNRMEWLEHVDFRGENPERISTLLMMNACNRQKDYDWLLLSEMIT